MASTVIDTVPAQRGPLLPQARRRRLQQRVRALAAPVAVLGRWMLRPIQWLLLLAVVTATLAPAVMLEQQSRLFVLKIVLAATLTVLPGWLYLLFIPQKGPRLYDEFVINLHRLQIDRLGNLPAPPQHTSYYADWRRAHDKIKAQCRTETADNLYRAQFEATYGRRAVSTRELLGEEDTTDRIRERTHTLTPVLLATFLIGIGWAVVVQPEIVRQFTLISEPAGGPVVPYEALRFGFLGAYWFILQDLVRRYYRDDLQTDAYISAVSRLVIVVLLVSAVALVPIGSPEQQQVLAFLIGVFPQIGIEALKAGVHSVFGKFVNTAKHDHPLGSLHGLTIWDEARLMEEGIEDLENLATANLVELLLSMRLPVARLVDWLDQAVLLVHLPIDVSAPVRGRYPAREGLQTLGILTATDLMAAWDEGSSVIRRVIAEAVFGPELGRGPAGIARTSALLTTIARESNMTHVRAFRAAGWLH